jgi:Protein of unknown function (DUF4065)
VAHAEWRENTEKFKELILYVSQKCVDDPRFGATKLNKILFFSDFLSYASLGQPITAVEYRKLVNGPAPRRLVPIRNAMVEARELAVQPVQLRSGKVQNRTVNLRKPNLSLFSAAEIALVDDVIDALRTADADTVSEISHKMMGWKITRLNETIPYETVFLSGEPLTEIEKQRALEVAADYGLVTA